MVSTREDAVRAVQACKYPPQGVRGIGGARRALYGGPDYLEHANEEIAVIVQIETLEAVQNIDEILSVPGIDVYFIGPNDLSAALGLRPSSDNRDPRFLEVVQRLIAAGRRHGIAGGIYCDTPEAASESIAWGLQFVSLANDMTILGRAAQSGLSAIRTRPSG